MESRNPLSNISQESSISELKPYPAAHITATARHRQHHLKQQCRVWVNGTLNQLQKTQGLMISIRKQWGIQATHGEDCSYSSPITFKQTNQTVFYQKLTCHPHIWQKTPVQHISKNTIQTNVQRSSSPKMSLLLTFCTILYLISVQVSSTYPKIQSAVFCVVT